MTNLDSAFECRFLYKIRFEKPDVQVRSKIMRQMIPELPQFTADTLAIRYEFSSSQIDKRIGFLGEIFRGKETAFPTANAWTRNGGVARSNGTSGSQVSELSKIAHKYCAIRQAILC